MTQPRDNTGMEELVEEIRLVWCEECADGPVHSEVDRVYSEGWEKVCATGAEDLCRERARKVFTLISQAIAEGKVKLPGEVDRGLIAAQVLGLADEQWLQQALYYPPTLLIALRKEGTGPLTGTGREEGGDVK